MIKRFCALAAASVLCACATPPAPLFNGSDMSGWELVTATNAALADSVRVLPGGIIAVTGEPVGYLASTTQHGDYTLSFDWRWSDKPGNAGALLHIASGPRDRAWPLSIQVQTKHTSVGDILPMAGASFSEPLTSAPGAAPQIKARTGADSEKPAGAWNACEIVSRAGSITVTVNGVVQNKISGAMPHAGKIGFQLEGTPFQLRNVKLSPL